MGAVASYFLPYTCPAKIHTYPADPSTVAGAVDAVKHKEGHLNGAQWGGNVTACVLQNPDEPEFKYVSRSSLVCSECHYVTLNCVTRIYASELPEGKAPAYAPDAVLGCWTDWKRLAERFAQEPGKTTVVM